jgi:hypothetical protein
MMDPISILALAGTCSAISGRVVTLVDTVMGLISRYREAERSATQMANRLRLFSVTVEELEKWLPKSTVSRNAGIILKASAIMRRRHHGY